MFEEYQINDVRLVHWRGLLMYVASRFFSEVSYVYVQRTVTPL